MNPDTAPSLPLRSQLPLQAGAVRLRALQRDDLEAFLAYRADPEVARFQGWSPMSQAQAAAFLDEMAAMTAWPPGAWLQIGIARRSDDRLVGDIGLLHEARGQVQLGFTLAPAAQGHGWAQAALRPLCELLLGPLRCHRLRAISDSRNTPSLRLLGRLGFTETHREAAVAHEEAYIDVVFERHAGIPASATSDTIGS